MGEVCMDVEGKQVADRKGKRDEIVEGQEQSMLYFI